MRRRLVWVATLSLTGALVSGCAPQAKQDAVRRIARAVDNAGLRTGSITVATRPLNAPQFPGPTVPKADVDLSSLLPTASLRVVIDRTGRRAALLAPPAAAARIGISEGDSFPALVLFDGDRIYVRSTDVGLIGARPWLAMDLADLGAVTSPSAEELAHPRTCGDLAIVSPVQVLDLALGVLTGSIKHPSPTTYKGSTSIEKEYRERDLEASDSDDFLEILSTFAVKDDINPIGVALDAQQRVKSVTVEFVGKPSYGVKFATRFALELDAPSAAVDKSVLTVPARDQVVEVSSIGDIRSAIDDWTNAEAKP